MKNQQDIPAGMIYFFLILIIDHAFFHILPTWLSSAPKYIMVFFIIVQAFRAYRITRIPELFAVTTGIFIILLQLPPVTTSNITTIPLENYNNTIFKTIANLIVISLILPWNWLSYQLINSKILKFLLVVSTLIVYPIMMIGQFFSQWAGRLYIFSVVFYSGWFIIAASQITFFYNSDRNKRGREFLIITSLCLTVPIILLITLPSSFTLSLAHLGVSIWLLLIWYTVASYPYAFILTQNQTVRAAKAYYSLKTVHETIDCMIYDNVDVYLRNIPEDSVMQVDDDKLTLLWIGLQRTESIE